MYLAWRFGVVAVKTVGWTAAQGGPTRDHQLRIRVVTIGHAGQNTGGTAEPMTFGGWNRVPNVASD